MVQTSLPTCQEEAQVDQKGFIVQAFDSTPWTTSLNFGRTTTSPHLSPLHVKNAFLLEKAQSLLRFNAHECQNEGQDCEGCNEMNSPRAGRGYDTQRKVDEKGAAQHVKHAKANHKAYATMTTSFNEWQLLSS